MLWSCKPPTLFNYSLVSQVNEVDKLLKLSIDPRKIIVLLSCISGQQKAPLGIKICQLMEAKVFKFLWATLLLNGQSNDDILYQMHDDHRVFTVCRRCLWTRRDITITKKSQLHLKSV
uniref:Uncharacterized protein n=1 Tax=Schistocephalus solidus TaxID=70667 RepID=A0A0V0J1J0_SCHSO